ncbi:MAG: heparan-alpha-glucosaminide N-acetyltransferase [Candidatus Hydrothermarchaeales archaeon]
MDKNFEKRFWEIDFFRGTAIIMMILFHFLFDITYFGEYNFNVYSGFWLYFARATATIFILLVGISLTLSFSRAKITQKAGKKLFIKYLKRGFRIFSWGLLITLITWIFLRNDLIIFGILHLIGISIILAYPFLELRFWNLIIGIFFISFGMYLKKFTFSSPWLLWLGLRSENFYPLDYFPIFPWFGVILIGLFFGNLLYPNHKRNFSLPDISNPFTNLFCFLGRHSLLIYLIHQPLLLGILHFSDVINIGFI